MPNLTCANPPNELRGSEIRAVIIEQMEQVAAQQGKHVASVRDSARLLDTGLDSLCLAILVANLEDQLALDPFADENVPFPITVGDFVRLYESAKAG